MIFNLQEHNSIANQFVAEIRNIKVQNDSMRFRRNLERLGEVLAYELSKSLSYKTNEIETPLGIAEIGLPEAQPVIATILRAGLPMHSGMLNYFDGAENAFISAYRKHHKDGTFEIKMEYISCPPLTDRILIICDPMLATGASLVEAVRALKAHGQPKSIHIVTAIAAIDGIDYVRRHVPEVNIWTAAIDEELTARSYIVPGLGDAGDLAFGRKVQE